MLEKRRQEIIDMIFEEALTLADNLDSNEVYNIAYKNMSTIKETYSIDELEQLYIETFKEFEELKLRDVKRKYIRKLDEYVKELRQYPNIDIGALEEYNYNALVTIDDCLYQKDVLSIYLHYISMLEQLKVTDIHQYYLTMVDDIAEEKDLTNPGVVLSINIAKNAIVNASKINEMNKIIDEFKATVGVKYTSIIDVRNYYKKQLLIHAKSRMNISNATSIMGIVEETFKIIDTFNDANELEVLYGQVFAMIECYNTPSVNTNITRKA